MATLSIKNTVITVTALIISGQGVAQTENNTEFNAQDMSVDALVGALNIPVRGIEAKCSPYQEQMTRLTRGLGVAANQVKKAEDVPALKTVKTASVPLTFRKNSAELTPETISKLEKIAEALNREDLSAQCFQLAGHTCDLGDDAYNMDLSRRRANSARTFLMSRGVDENRLVTTGYGETSPTAPNETEKDRERNRRVVVGALPPVAMEYQ